MRGNSDQSIALPSLLKNRTGVTSAQSVGRQVHPMGSTRERNVNAGIYQKPRARAGGNQPHRFFRKPVQLAPTEVFFSELDVVHAGGHAFGDLREHAPLLVFRAAGKRAAISDVAKLHRFSNLVIWQLKPAASRGFVFFNYSITKLPNYQILDTLSSTAVTWRFPALLPPRLLLRAGRGGSG